MIKNGTVGNATLKWRLSKPIISMITSKMPIPVIPMSVMVRDGDFGNNQLKFQLKNGVCRFSFLFHIPI